MTTLALDERAIEVSGDVLMAALAEIATESHDYACGEGIEHPARLSHRLG